MAGSIAADERFMRMALEEAHAAAKLGEVPIGAVVVHEGEVIARAHNRRELDEDPSAHAEFAAMMEASRVLGRWRLTGCTVYVTLEPCLMCAGLMVNARIDRCVYGAYDPKGGAVGTLFDVSCDARLNHAFEVTSGVLERECAQELSAFFARLRGAKSSGAEASGAEAECAQGAEDGRAGEESGCKLHSGMGRTTTGGPVAAECPESDVAVPERAVKSALRPAGLAARSSSPARVRVASVRAHASKVVLALDSFKGSASSEDAEAWLAQGIRSSAPGFQLVCIPMADGGEGTLEAVRACAGGALHEVEVSGPLGDACRASYLLATGGEADPFAVMETAQAAGIAASPCTHGAAVAASTCGVGELMLQAIAGGARTLYVGLGGSATTDGGVGMLQALGAQVLDDQGKPVQPGIEGLAKIASIDLAPARRALCGVRVVALSDVKNPLVGPRGAVRVFGPQKGLCAGFEPDERDACLDVCDRWMAAYGARLTAARDALDGSPSQVATAKSRPKSLAGVPGAGAAGGLGAALLALGAELTSGADAMLELSGFDGEVADARAVITGEGSVDAQTAEGKVPAGVARRAKKLRPDVPVFAVCGSRAENLDAVYRAGIDAVFPIGMGPQPLHEALTAEEVRKNLIATGEMLGRLIALI
ncbi:MAG: tRNA adenosine(34) deaminase TadA [Coriobacteriaceae bacterium]|nr:tRNA adenosine(34) deaminase TadA [Coriobacteriaceae bacterium]